MKRTAAIRPVWRRPFLRFRSVCILLRVRRIRRGIRRGGRSALGLAARLAECLALFHRGATVGAGMGRGCHYLRSKRTNPESPQRNQHKAQSQIDGFMHAQGAKEHVPGDAVHFGVKIGAKHQAAAVPGAFGGGVQQGNPHNDRGKAQQAGYKGK